MTGQGQRNREAMLARLAAYRKLRDDGMLPFDAGNELGVSDRTRAAYERWYRREAGLPPRPRGFGDVPPHVRESGGDVL